MSDPTRPPLRVALAQCGGGDRVARHAALIREHADCDLIVFPELSLTGYVDAGAAEHAMTPEDPAFQILQRACDEVGVAAAVGAPLRVARDLHIAMVLVRPGASPQWYAKRHLHADEVPFFTPGIAPPVFLVRGYRLGLGVCYESTFDAHLEDVFARGVDAYVVSVAKPAHVRYRRS